MLKSILKALIVFFAPTLLLIIAPIPIYYIVSKLQGDFIGDITSCLIIILFASSYCKVLDKIGELVNRL